MSPSARLPRVGADLVLSRGHRYTAPVHALTYILIALLFGCAAEQPPPLAPDHPRALLNKFEAFAADLTAQPSPAKAVAFIEAFTLTEPQMLTLFGPEKGAKAWTGYTESILPAMRAESGAVLMREILEEKRIDAWVEPVGPAWPGVTTRGDLQILDALAEKRPVYTARLRRPNEALGLRINGFVYIDGAWKALFKIYEHL